MKEELKISEDLNLEEVSKILNKALKSVGERMLEKDKSLVRVDTGELRDSLKLDLYEDGLEFGFNISSDVVQDMITEKGTSKIQGDHHHDQTLEYGIRIVYKALNKEFNK